jgi:hypothetical protein
MAKCVFTATLHENSDFIWKHHSLEKNVLVVLEDTPNLKFENLRNYGTHPIGEWEGCFNASILLYRAVSAGNR